MREISDVFTVSYDAGSKDESVLCVIRKCGEKIIISEMIVGEQADILYRSLTKQQGKKVRD